MAEESPRSPATVTDPEPVGLARIRRSRRIRRAYFVVLCAFLLLALLNVFGLRTREAAANGGGYELTVTFATVSRAGLPTPWSAEIRHPGGFDGPVTLATNSAYFDAFDEHGIHPEPSSATADADRVIWEFEPPSDSDTLMVAVDGRISPSTQLERVKGTTEVFEDDRPLLSVSYRTWVMP